MKQVTQSDAFAAIKDGRVSKLVVELFTPTCVPCKKLEPKLDALAAIFKDVAFVKIDASYADDFVNAYAVTAVPTVLVFKNGSLARYLVGPMLATIEEAIREC